LTALLHIKPQKTKDFVITKSTISITIKDLEGIFNDVFKTTRVLKDGSKTVLKLIMELCKTLSDDIEEYMNLENKLVLSIGIRLQAEAFMKDKINDNSVTDHIKKNQTSELLKLYKKSFSSETSNLQILEQVNLMTPENIHLNSFMYEPLMDISDRHLKLLYKRVEKLII